MNYLKNAFKALDEIKDELDFKPAPTKSFFMEAWNNDNISVKRYSVFIFPTEHIDDYSYASQLDFTSKEEAEDYAKLIKDTKDYGKIIIRESELGEEGQVKTKETIIESALAKDLVISGGKVDEKEIKQAKKMLDETPKAKEDDVQVVIDTNAEEVAETKNKNYVGKYLLQCPICNTIIYKDNKELVSKDEKDDEGNIIFNKSETCPHCHIENKGFILVGQVGKPETEKEVKEKEEIIDKPTKEVEVKKEVEVEENINEDLNDKSDYEELKGKVLMISDDIYYTLDYADDTIIAGNITNKGLYPVYKWDIDYDLSVDKNLQDFFDYIVAHEDLSTFDSEEIDEGSMDKLVLEYLNKHNINCKNYSTKVCNHNQVKKELVIEGLYDKTPLKIKLKSMHNMPNHIIEFKGLLESKTKTSQIKLTCKLKEGKLIPCRLQNRKHK